MPRCSLIPPELACRRCASSAVDASRPVEAHEHTCPAASEQRLERLVVAILRRPELGHARGRIHEGRLPGEVDHRPDGRPGERGRDEQQTAAPEVDVDVVRRAVARDVHGAVVPADRVVQAREGRLADGGQTAAPRDLGLEQADDAVPARGQRRVPERAHLGDEAADGPTRVLREPRPCLRQAARMRPRDLGGDLLGRGGHHAYELVVQPGVRDRRRRGDEVQSEASSGTATSSSDSSRPASRGAAHAAQGWWTANRSGARTASKAPTVSISGEIAKRVRSRSSCPKR